MPGSSVGWYRTSARSSVRGAPACAVTAAYSASSASESKGAARASPTRSSRGNSTPSASRASLSPSVYIGVQQQPVARLQPDAVQSGRRPQTQGEDRLDGFQEFDPLPDPQRCGVTTVDQADLARGELGEERGDEVLRWSQVGGEPGIEGPGQIRELGGETGEIPEGPDDRRLRSRRAVIPRLHVGTRPATDAGIRPASQGGTHAPHVPQEFPDPSRSATEHQPPLLVHHQRRQARTAADPQQHGTSYDIDGFAGTFRMAPHPYRQAALTNPQILAGSSSGPSPERAPRDVPSHI